MTEWISHLNDTQLGLIALGLILLWPFMKYIGWPIITSLAQIPKWWVQDVINEVRREETFHYCEQEVGESGRTIAHRYSPQQILTALMDDRDRLARRLDKLEGK